MIDCLADLVSKLRPLILASFGVSSFSYESISVDSPNIIILLHLDSGQKVILKGLSSGYWLGHRAEEELEAHQFLAKQVSKHLNIASAPYQWPDNAFLLPCHNHSWLLLPWIDGAVREQFSPAMAHTVGQYLAKLHQLSLPKYHLKRFPSIHATFDGPSWLLELISDCNQIIKNDSFDTIMSHRDIHPGNMIWQSDKQFRLIDWESAGLINPFVELVGVALNVAGLPNKALNMHLFSEVLMAYHNQSGTLPKTCEKRWLLIFQSWLIWYEYCLHNHKNEAAKDTEQSLTILYNQLDNLKKTYNESGL